ncbi:hypothetical protein GCM10023310_44790 [Paenibacillus vulneris]|uniref:LysM peptidoglycan-binding domain-containing protein n=1 Tax=Paenibacillus vulneris TaxID=1133364 RepID=A0ABW3UYI7_9BACL|nr:LysM peptidoglycan-binding domain-containing protein [Paenibacillus sp. 32352]
MYMNEQLLTNSVVSVQGNRRRGENPNGTKRRMRGLFVIALVILIASICLSFIGGNSDAFAADTGSHLEQTVEVVKGDTLWGIASKYAGKGRNVRDYMYEVKKVNDLKSNVLQVGQVLVLP